MASNAAMASYADKQQPETAKNYMRALVTGAGGFLGGAIARKLCADGHEVVALVRRPSGHGLEDLGMRVHVADVRYPEQINRHFDGITHVFHIAAAYRRELTDRNEFTRVNVDGTANVLDAAAEAGVERFVHCSTVGVHGHIDSPPGNENNPLNPMDHYQRSKLAGETLARSYFANGLPGVVIRPSALYGPGDLRFLKLFKTISNGTFCMIGNGKTLYHMSYIDDMVECFVRAGLREDAIGETLIVAGSRFTTIRELVNTVADVLGKRHPRLSIPMLPARMIAIACDRACRAINVQPPLYPRRLDFFKHSRAFSSDHAQNILDYTPKVDLHDGLQRTAKWYMDEGLL